MIFDRLGSTADSWWSRPDKMSQGRLLGRYFAAKRERLREVARGWLRWCGNRADETQRIRI